MEKEEITKKDILESADDYEAMKTAIRLLDLFATEDGADTRKPSEELLEKIFSNIQSFSTNMFSDFMVRDERKCTRLEYEKLRCFIDRIEKCTTPTEWAAIVYTVLSIMGFTAIAIGFMFSYTWEDEVVGASALHS